MRIGTVRGLLVVAPHPDDETIGAYGLMMRLRRRGMTVRVVVVTDGAASHPGSLAWPRKRLTRERQRETRRALRRIGLTPSDITFLNLPDGALNTAADAVRRRVAASVRRMPKPSLVVAPTESDAHPDHRVVAAGVKACRVSGTRSLTYAVWPVGPHGRGASALPLTRAEQLAKRHAIRSYLTQTGRITDDPSGFAMTDAQIVAFSRPAEVFMDLHR